MTKYSESGLNQSVLRAVQEGGYEDMTPIQSQAIPNILEGKDLIGLAQTGTGKTAAFSLPIIQKLLKDEGKRTPKEARSLILAPTRELAVQIAENIKGYTKYLHLRMALVYGGASPKSQVKAMLGGADILIATPGRLLDLMNQKHISLQAVEFLVLDEADRMLDMGFIRDIRKIVERLPKNRQTVLFSATMPKSVEGLAASILRDPVRIQVAPTATTAEKVDQHVLMVPKDKKRQLLAHLLKDNALNRVLIFTRTKHGANRVSRQLEQLGISSGAIHGNKSQNARQKALNEFKTGEIRVLVATDVAARGIDVNDVSHVINFEIPNEPESYVHRIGRTARAGAAGVSLSFVGHDERDYLRDIEKTIRQQIPIEEDHPFHQQGMEPLKEKPEESGGNRPANRNNRSNSGRHNANRRSSQPKNTDGAKPSTGGQRKRRSTTRRSRPANTGT
jgi:ATP-dependent RNA helicase RhlE